MVISITTLLMCDSVAMSSGVPHHEWSIGTESRPRSYEITNGWGGRHPVNGAPVFVLTHNPPTEYPKGPSRLTFVTDGIASAIRQPQEVAGGKNIKLGGASPGKQALAAGLCDEIVVHLAPYLPRSTTTRGITHPPERSAIPRSALTTLFGGVVFRIL
jgi:hypothetical protein